MSPDFPPYYQVEWVAGVSRWWPYSHYTEEYSLRVWNNKALLMRLARENLALTTWFGITERFNESICLFYYTHRLPPKVEGKDYKSIHRYVTGAGSDTGVVATAEDLQRPRLVYVHVMSFMCYTHFGLNLSLRYEYEFIRWAEKLFELRLANMKEDYRVHRKVMTQYIAPECIGVLT